MAKVILPFGRNGEVAPLPPVCISCGAPATHTLKMQFFDKPEFLKPGKELEFVVAEVPLCEGHPFMGQARWMIIVGFFLLVVLIIPAALFDQYIHRYVFVYPVIALVLVGTAFVLWVSFTSLGSDGFTKKGVEVTNASSQFVEALKEQEWTEDEFEDALFENRGGRKRKPPLWASPYVYVPVAIGVAYLLGSPIGFLVAMNETEGAWPARKPGPPPNNNPGPPPGPKDGPPKDGPPKDEPPKDGPKPIEKDKPKPETLPGLIAYWPLDEKAGGGRPGKPGGLALVNGAKWVEGREGSALQFNGKGDHVNLGPGAPVNFNAKAPFTLACWARTEADDGTIVSFRNSGKAQPVIAIQVRGGKVTGWVRDDGALGGAALVTGASIKDGKWHHVALVRHPDGKIEVFLDAVSQGKKEGANSSGAITTDLRTLGSDRIPMGPKVKVKKFPDFAGSIDEFCVYNRALDEKDIAILAGDKK